MTMTAPERTETRQWLNRQGFAVELLEKRAERVQWYKADGTPIGGLLPADPYHMARYRAKGWRLTKYTDEQIETMQANEIHLVEGSLPNEPEAPLYIADKPKAEKKQRRKRGRPRKTKAGAA